MPDLPGSGPPDPDSFDRLVAIIKALRAGTDPGVKISPTIARLLLGVHAPESNVVVLGGIDHLAYEVNGRLFLSPSVT